MARQTSISTATVGIPTGSDPGCSRIPFAQKAQTAVLWAVTFLVACGTGCTSCSGQKTESDPNSTAALAARARANAAVRSAVPAGPAPVVCRPVQASMQLLPVPAVGQHRVILSWKASIPLPGETPGDVKGYCVYRRESLTAPEELIHNTPINGTSCVDNRVVNGHAYFYAVTAINGQSTQSGFSKGTTAQIPNTPASGPIPPNLPQPCWVDAGPN